LNAYHYPKTVFTTERGARHQQHALSAAPDRLDITMLREPDQEAMRAALANAEYLISERVGAVDADLLAAAPALKLILRIGSLAHDIDLDACRKAGVIVARWPDSGVIHVAEHVVMQMLALAKKLREVESIARAASPEWGPSRRTDEDTFAYNWSARGGVRRIDGATVGILGFGEIGAELARRLAGWNCTVLYHKRRRLPESVEHELQITYAERDALLARADFLVNLLPYFPETDKSLDAATFSALPDGAFVVSAGSGSVIDEGALADAVRAGKLAGVALDTFEWEPLRPNNPLVLMAEEGANVLLTPHTAAGSGDSSPNSDLRTAQYTPIRDHLAGHPVRGRVV
jgi:phosphoglycerate dehydrogenase-like enzyme